MITEDYVSFETAKLLKKKGFDYECACISHPQCGIALLGHMINNTDLQLTREADLCIDKENLLTIPTLQMAMKWLREVHNLSTEVYRTACGYIGCIVAIPSGTDIKFLEEDGDDLPSGTYTKWEYACEEAIKYCLENLI